MSSDSKDLRQGTLAILVLKALLGGPAHWYNRRARFYTITAAGRAHLRAEAALWMRYATPVTRVLRAEPRLA
jgi:hypothetical protein